MATPSSPISSGDGVNATRQIVPVVPMFAPMMTLIACGSVSMPDETKPTSIAVMMADDWTMSVENRPVPTPRSRWLVACAMKERRPPPAAACRPSERCFIPRRNRPRPPSSMQKTARSAVCIVV